MRPSPVSTDIDLDRDGVQHGHLKLPWSRDRSAWGALMVPIAVVRNGNGPTALLTGASHGDELEGPIALFELARTLQPETIRGCVVVLPALNYLAFRAGRRVSPEDGGNMNRSFPGRPDGTLTEKIADYVTRCLLPRADVVLDIHSGGRTLEFVPFAASHVLPDKMLEAACAAARDAFNAPWSMQLLELDDAGMLDRTAEAAGKVFVTTELGGGGTSRPDTVAIARRGIANLLVHADILRGTAERQPSRQLAMPDARCYVTSRHAGLLEPRAGLGQPVRAGETVARVSPIERTGVPPADYVAECDGLLAGRHFPGLVEPGDVIAVVAQPVD